MMSRFLSLCSQRSACGKLAKSVQLLANECEDWEIHEKDEVRLGKVIGKAEHVGCDAGDKKKIVEEFESLCTCGEYETEESKRVKVRAFE